MNESLFLYAILLKCELISLGSFEQYLNNMFLKYPDNELLLELQWASADTNKVIQTISESLSKEVINYTIVGQILLNELERIYDPLSWGDEQQTRSLYEKMFHFYKVEGD